MQKKVVVASTQEAIKNIISKIDGFQDVVGVTSRDNLVSTCNSFKPDILVITDRLLSSDPKKSTVTYLLNFHQHFPSIRIIYLAGEVDMNDIRRVTELASLVEDGIYDIYHKKQLSKSILTELLTLPKTENEVQYLLQYKESYDDDYYDDFDLEEDEYYDEGDVQEGIDNVFVLSSIKPGTGKSFVATNVSTAIAKFGRVKKNGQLPRVALIEGDLQNLSIGTLLQIENDRDNIKTALDAIAKIVTTDGEILDENPALIEEVNRYIIKCFQPYSKAKNLYALVGSQIRMEDMENVSPYHYYYLVEVASKYFDVVIIDSNSSLEHVTTVPILQLAKTCYYILNLDFNNVRNNARYRLTLESLDLAQKLKYILNEDIGKNSNYAEKLKYDSTLLAETGFDVIAKIPTIDKSIFLNRLYEGRPIVLDDTPYTLDARIELEKIANEIWTLDNMDDLKLEQAVRDKNMTKNKKKKGGLFSGLFGKK